MIKPNLLYKIIFILVIVLVLGSTYALRPAVAQTMGNDPWNWCNFHPYSQSADEAACEEEAEEGEAAPISAPTPLPLPSYSMSPTPANTSLIAVQSQLRSLMQQHASLSANALMARFDQRADYPNWQQAVDQNTQQLGSLIGSVYGMQAQSDFLTIWQNHIDALNGYVDAVKTNDQNAKNQALGGLSDFVKNISSFFYNHQSTQQNLESLFQGHINDETRIVDDHSSGNQQLIPGVLAHASQDANMIVDALIYPNGTPTPLPAGP